MTSESKILTVSYGTFSCTLEGFDDPFNTMKAVAEYFRDLAAEDRYFGSEPPVPDAAMLHRIAEREVQRMVEARVQDKGVFLRQQDAPPAAPLPSVMPTNLADAPAPEPAAAPVIDTEDTSAPILQDSIPGGVAAKLARIRQFVNVTPPVATPAASLPAAAPDPVPEPQAEVDATDAYLLDLAAAPVEPEAEADSTEVEDALSRLLSLSDEPTPDDDLPVFTSEADAEPTPSVVAQDNPDEPEGDIPHWLARDDTPEDQAAAAPADLPALADEAIQLHSAPVDFWTAEAANLDDDVITEKAEAPTAKDDSDALVLTPALLLTDTVEEDPATPISADEAVDTLPEDQPENPDAAIAATLAAAAAEDQPKSAKKRTNSRMLRKGPEEPAAKDVGQDLDVDRLLRQADDEMADVDNRRRLSAIAHLKAAVAATEAERAVTGEAMNPPGAKIEPYRDDLAQVVQPVEPEPEQAVKPRRKSVTIRPQEPRPGTIRPGMVGPAPLVLVSEQRIDRTPPTGQPVVAVRSGRLSGSIGAGAGTQQPPRVQMPRPAAAPIISSDREEDDEDADDNVFVNEAGFSSFAEKVGVKSLADMLEAAAAYATCMEHRDQFTRPQLMRRLIASAAGKPVSREDGLRSFGTLLRTGRIEKVSRGHYSLPDNSPYLAEARRIAN